MSAPSKAESVGTLARGLDVLDLFASHGPALTQKEIAGALGLPVPTVHRLTKLLLERGYLVRERDGRRLRLGLGVARLLPAVLSGLRLPDVARDHLRALAEETGETASLAVLDGGEVVYLLSESGGRLLTPRAEVGLRLPAHCTALGKCLLAQLPDREARRAAGREPYPALTERTLTTWKALRASIEEVRRSGVALSHQEYELGLDSVAVPVEWGEGPVAVNVSLPSPRATSKVRATLAARLRAAAGAIETLSKAA
jgi:IclR family acetate operon transcriptional repressor